MTFMTQDRAAAQVAGGAAAPRGESLVRLLAVLVGAVAVGAALWPAPGGGCTAGPASPLPLFLVEWATLVIAALVLRARWPWAPGRGVNTWVLAAVVVPWLVGLAPALGCLPSLP